MERDPLEFRHKRAKYEEDSGVSQFRGTQSQSENNENEEFVYGYLVVLGHSHKIKPDGEANIVFPLKKRPVANGIRATEERMLSVSQDDTLVPTRTGTTHSISFCWGKAERGIVEYALDEKSDLYQFGRAPTNDFVLPGLFSSKGASMSRYSFRIECEREEPNKCRIFAGGFDENNQLFLGQGALCWVYPNKDGFITNGVRIMWKALQDGEKRWTEVSCRGKVFSIRPNYKSRGELLNDYDNVLQNGTLISIGGVTMMWLSSEFVSNRKQWNVHDFAKELNRQKIQCPVQLSTIYFGSPSTESEQMTSALQPWVFTKCGHVHGYNPQLANAGAESKCTICRETGTFTSLKMESDIVLQIFCTERPNHVFNPCGHAIDLQGAILWSSIHQPTIDELIHNNPAAHLCPFCRTELSESKPYSKLIYQTDVG